MQHFTVLSRKDVSEINQTIFDNLKNAIGFVPNLYATMAHSETALGNYLQLQNGKTSLSNKEKEVVNLVVSQVNECNYCLAAHTAIGKMNGFTDEQILQIRRGSASFDHKLHALAVLTKEIAITRGRPNEETLKNFFAAGYSKGTLVDLLIAVADKTVMNYLHNITQIPIDFPVAPSLEISHA